jgi:hypothetical protein
LKTDIEDLLGIKANRPAINTNMSREVEDLLRARRPFYRPGNNNTTAGSNNDNRAGVVNAQEESSNTVNRNRGGINREHSRSHRHGHHRVHSRTKHK